MRAGIVGIAFFSTIVFQGVALACPVSIAGVQAEAVGRTHGYVEYQMILEAPRNSAYVGIVRLTLTGGSPDILVKTSAIAGADDSLFVFYRPAADVVALQIDSLQTVADGKTITCSDAPRFELNPSEAHTVTPFDDSPEMVTLEHPAYAITGADMLIQAKPVYPFMAQGFEIQGTVVVKVTIGPRGEVLDAGVARSSGNQWLDAAALKAAQKSTFKPAKMPSSSPNFPLVTSSEIEYEFRLTRSR
jgi:TonB family protein